MEDIVKKTKDILNNTVVEKKIIQQPKSRSLGQHAKCTKKTGNKNKSDNKDSEPLW